MYNTQLKKRHIQFTIYLLLVGLIINGDIEYRAGDCDEVYSKNVNGKCSIGDRTAANKIN